MNEAPTKADIERAVVAWALAYEAHIDSPNSKVKFQVYSKHNGHLRRLALRISASRSGDA